MILLQYIIIQTKTVKRRVNAVSFCREPGQVKAGKGEGVEDGLGVVHRGGLQGALRLQRGLPVIAIRYRIGWSYIPYRVRPIPARGWANKGGTAGAFSLVLGVNPRAFFVAKKRERSEMPNNEYASEPDHRTERIR